MEEIQENSATYVTNIIKLGPPQRSRVADLLHGEPKLVGIVGHLLVRAEDGVGMFRAPSSSVSGASGESQSVRPHL